MIKFTELSYQLSRVGRRKGIVTPRFVFRADRSVMVPSIEIEKSGRSSGVCVLGGGAGTESKERASLGDVLKC